MQKVSKQKFLSAKEPKFCVQIKSQAVKNANQQCELGGNWEDWDDLFAGCYGKSSHGRMTYFFSTYYGIQNTYKNVCERCPRIQKDAWEKLRSHEDNFK